MCVYQFWSSAEFEWICKLYKFWPSRKHHLVFLITFLYCQKVNCVRTYFPFLSHVITMGRFLSCYLGDRVCFTSFTLLPPVLIKLSWLFKAEVCLYTSKSLSHKYLDKRLYWMIYFYISKYACTLMWQGGQCLFQCFRVISQYISSLLKESHIFSLNFPNWPTGQSQLPWAHIVESGWVNNLNLPNS